MLFLKLLLAPALVGIVTVAGRRFGPRVAGVLAGLPIVGGPILLVVTVDQGTAFAAGVATSTMMGLFGTGAFAVAYAWSSHRLSWWKSLLVGWSAFAVGAWLMNGAELPALAAAGVAVVSVTAAILSMPRERAEAEAPRRPWWDLPLRMASTAALVTGITLAAALLGPRWTGLLTPFPIATTVLAAFAHAQTGTATRLLRGLLAGLYGFVAFMVVVALLVEPLGPWAAFGMATLAAVVVNGAVLLLRR